MPIGHFVKLRSMDVFDRCAHLESLCQRLLRMQTDLSESGIPKRRVIRKIGSKALFEQSSVLRLV